MFLFLYRNSSSGTGQQEKGNTLCWEPTQSLANWITLTKISHIIASLVFRRFSWGTCHTSHSRTLINNIFSNVILKDIICGNITATISDHLPQFLISPNTFANPPSNKSNVFEKDWPKFDQENLILDYFDTDWSNLSNLNEKKRWLNNN